MNLKQKYEAALQAAREIAEGAKGRAFTDQERTDVDAHLAEADRIDAELKSAEADEARMKRLGALTPAAAASGSKADERDGDKPARSLGDHFAKHAGAEGFRHLKERGGFTISTPEWTPDGAKANTDPNLIGSSFGGVLTEVDQTIVRGFRRDTVEDLFGTGQMAGTAVTYFVEGAVEGNFGTVAEGAQKPQIHFVNPTTQIDSAKKIAAWFDTSDEMIEDLPFFVSEINNRALYLLALANENQLLNGDGTGNNILGIANRSGIQTVTQGSTGFTGETAADAIFRAMTAVQTATGLSADGIIINPIDYQSQRLSKDANGQYYGGGFFSGEYGVGGITLQPPLWGQRTVVSTATAAKTVWVGAFKAATTVYPKGGVRVESTNSDQGKFTKNIVTTRVENRKALACRIPSALVKVTLT